MLVDWQVLVIKVDVVADNTVNASLSAYLPD